MIAPDRMCAPTSEPFSIRQTETSLAGGRRELLQSDRRGESRRSAADDDDVEFHGFALHGGHPLRRIGCAARARGGLYNAATMTQKPRILVHTSRQAIRWADMDGLGHVNNTVYFRYCEQARIEWLGRLHPNGELFAGTGPVIVNASCTFLMPLVYPGDVEVRMYLGDPGRTSVGSFYEILKDGTKFADGAAKIVWIDIARGRSVPLPETVTSLVSRAGTGPGDCLLR